jgi:hypothetical protein
MALFRSTADLKLYTDVHKQTDWATLRLYVQQAEPYYIIPFISQAMYDDFNALINDPANATKTFDEIFTDELDLTAFNFIAGALANYALYEAFPFLNTAVGDMGVAQISSKEGTTNPAPQWRYEGRRWAHILNGDRFIDQLLAFMEDNAGYFTDWAASSSYTVNKDLFIADSFKLSKYIGTNNRRRAYLALRAHIRMAEKKYILPALGQDLFDELKTQMQTNPPSVSDANNALLPLIEEGLAWAAYYEGLPFLTVKFDTTGVYVASPMDTNLPRPQQDQFAKEMVRKSAANNMDGFLATLKKFLIDNVADYPLFQNSDAYCNNNPRYRRPRNHWRSGMFRV